MRTLGFAGLIGLLAAIAVAAAGKPSQGEDAMKKQETVTFEAADPAFKDIIGEKPEVRQVAGGLQFTEGPAWFADGRYLLFSDIPADTIYKWSEADGLKAWRKPSHNSNGNTADRQGRLVTCEHGSRTVTRTDKDGKVETVASTYLGRKLSSPNDAAVKGDGTIWFTDPPYGVDRKLVEQEKNRVYRLDPGAKEPVAVAEDFDMPNGLCFSPDEKLLYVADSGKPHHVRRFRVKADNMLEGGEVFAVISPGGPDGIRCDRQGRLFSTAGDGVQVFSTEGKLLGRIKTPQTAANCTFGGPDLKTLFITARQSVWAVKLAVPGAR